MKNCLLLCALFFLFFQSCTDTKPEAIISEATLSGQIENPAGTEILLSGGDEKHQATLTDGHFSITLPISEATRFTFKHGNEYGRLYLEPGDDVQLSLNAENFDNTLTFKGTGAEENNYIISKYLLEESLTSDFEAWYKSAPADFIQTWEKLHREMNTHFTNYSMEHKTQNPDFIKREATDLLYQSLNQRLNYRNYHSYFTKNDPVLPADFYDFLSGVNLNEADLLDSEEYQSFLRAYIEEMDYQAAQEKGIKEPSNEASAQSQLAMIGTLVHEQKIKDHLSFELLTGYLESNGIAGIETLMPTFEKLCTNQEYKDEVQKTYEDWKKIAVGAEAPNFVTKDIKGQEVSLHQLRGRNVYIDVWATWCGPCLRELPHLEKLEKKYSDKGGLVFASISVDKDTEAWEKMVTDKEMQGLQLLANNAWDSDICQEYQINSIPRFILIDKSGQIINANAPRPSSKEIDGILSKLAVEKYTTMKH